MPLPQAFDPAQLRELPQALGRWELGVRPAPPELRRIERGKVVVVLDSHSGLARASNVVPEASTEALTSVLLDAMTRSASGQAACRPRLLAVETRSTEQALARALEPCGIRLVVVPLLPLVDDFMQGLREHMRGRPPRSPIGALVMEKPLAEAAARIAALEPWRYIPGELPLLLGGETSDEPPRVLVVMGEARRMEGVAAYDDEAQLQRAVQSELPFGSWCLLFHRAYEVPRRIRDEFIQLGLPVAHGLYPHYALLARAGVPAIIEGRREARRILAELEALERYVRECSQALADGLEPVGAGLELSSGQRVCITPKRAVAQEDLYPEARRAALAGAAAADGEPAGGERAPAESADRGAEPAAGSRADPAPAAEPDLRSPSARPTPPAPPDGGRQAEPWPVAEAAPASGYARPPTHRNRGEEDRCAAAAGLPFGVDELTYRVTLCTMPTPLLRRARGARIAIWQAEQRLGRLPETMSAIILKMAKPAATTAARKLHRIDRASFRELRLHGLSYELLVISRGDEDERALASWLLRAGERAPSAWNAETGDATGALLLFVSGGAERALRALAPGAIVAGQHVAVVRP